MKGHTIPSTLYRVHANGGYPLELLPKSGAYRWDDARSGRSRRFHMLYAGDSIEGGFVEKLQRFAADDEEAHSILGEVAESDSEHEAMPVEPGRVPASVLRGLAVSVLEVLDPTSPVLDPFDHQMLKELFGVAEQCRVSVPNSLKTTMIAPDDAKSLQFVATLIYELTDAVGIVARSSLDNPRSENVHSVYSLFRALPEEGGETRLPLRRLQTTAAIPAHLEELRGALAQLGVRPEIPLDHPDIVGTQHG